VSGMENNYQIKLTTTEFLLVKELAKRPGNYKRKSSINGYSL
jgi:hypothetical protein